MLIESHITHDRVYSIRLLLIRPYLQWGSDYMAQKDFMTKNNKNRYNGHVAKNNKVGKEVSNEERRVTRRVRRPCAVIRARGARRPDRTARPGYLRRAPNTIYIGASLVLLSISLHSKMELGR